jgi:AraC family transcriptional regulator
MHRVVAYIDQHLDQPLDLCTMAEVAHFSQFHFHRLFSAWMGETLGDYLRRRRVEVAAMRLAAQPRSTVLNTALSVGFSSGEAFTRAFRSRFGCSPTTWRAQQAAQHRANSNPDQVDSKMSQSPVALSEQHEVSPAPNTETIMNVKLIDRQPVTVAYLRHLGSYGEPLSLFWQNTYYPWAVTNNLLQRPRYGISHDDPSITAAEQCRYDACAEVAPNFVASGGAFKTPFRAAGMLSSASRVLANRWVRLGPRCSGIGCPPADFNSMPVRASSITRKTQRVTRRPGRSSARYAFPWFRFDREANSRGVQLTAPDTALQGARRQRRAPEL